VIDRKARILAAAEQARVKSTDDKRRLTSAASCRLAAFPLPIAQALIIAVAQPLSAQADSAFKKVLQLNRTGAWAEAAAAAQHYLAPSATSPQSSRVCGLREQLVYAETRLGHRDTAKAALAAFDRACSNVLIGDGFRVEVSRLRGELADSAGFSSTTQLPRPTTSVAEADDGFWQIGDPIRLGLNLQALNQHRLLCEETGADACLVVFKGQQIVQEWYSPHYHRPIYAMSTTKSITGLLVGLLVDDGRIPTLDEPVCMYVAAWCSGRRGSVTLRHLLTMTSGLPRMRDSSVGFVDDKDTFVLGLSPTAEPGTQWAYSNEGAQLLSPVLDRAAGEPIQEYARRRLFEPLGMRGTRLHVDARNHAWTYADMETTPRDLARIGVLMLNGGVWRGHRVLSQAWIDSSTHPSQQLNRTYGLLWWLHDDPPGFAGHGHLDTNLHVFPALDLVVVRMQAEPVAGVPEGTYEARALELYRAMVPDRARK
jgi:CubicO group peptidase (beta-lactamase class C family)